MPGARVLVRDAQFQDRPLGPLFLASHFRVPDVVPRVVAHHQPASPARVEDHPANKRVFFDASSLDAELPGNPDGLKVDQQGNLMASGPGGLWIISPDGKHLGTIRIGHLISNCAFGDDGRTLYLTCDELVCRVRLNTKGIGF